MAQLITAILLIGLAFAAIKIAFLFLILAGLIFRTNETVGLLLVGGMFALFRAHFLLGLCGVGLVIAAVIYRASMQAKDEATSALPDDTKAI